MPKPTPRKAPATGSAAWSAPTPQRVSAAPVRHSRGNTGVGDPQVAAGLLLPGLWLPERRKRAERALTTVVATCYLLGVSTWRMDRLVETLGITSLSKPQVSVMAKELDAAVEAFRSRPLDAGPYTFVAADALVLKGVRAAGVVNVHALIATGVNAEGYREIPASTSPPVRTGPGVLAVADRPRPEWGSPGHLRCPRRAGRRDRGHPCRGGLAALPHALHDQPHGDYSQSVLAVGSYLAALGVRSARR